MKKRNMIEYLIPIGILLIFIGFIIVFAGAAMQAKAPGAKTKTHVGVGGFIGPIPFGFATSKTMLYIVIGVAIFFFILWLILRYVGV